LAGYEHGTERLTDKLEKLVNIPVMQYHGAQLLSSHLSATPKRERQPISEPLVRQQTQPRSWHQKFEGECGHGRV